MGSYKPKCFYLSADSHQSKYECSSLHENVIISNNSHKPTYQHTILDV